MREINSSEWGAFCDRLNQFEYGANLTIEVLDRNGVQKQVARDVPFEEIRLGRQDACSDRISIRATGKTGTKHDVIEPIRIRLRETEDGHAFNAVAIEAEESTTFLIFHPVIRPQWLEGL